MKTSFYSVVLLLLVALTVNAQTVPFRNSSILGSSRMNNNNIETKSGRVVSKNKLMRYREEKSPIIAAGLSLLLPGAGEYYGEDYLRAGIFLGIDAIAFTGYFVNEKDGDDKTSSFEDYADEHFNENWYYGAVYQIVADSIAKVDESSNIYGWDFADIKNRDNWDYGDDDDKTDLSELWKSKMSVKPSHQLPATKTQQYYEMIGKYRHFQAGWDDFTGYNKNNSEYEGSDLETTISNGDGEITVPTLEVDAKTKVYTDDKSRFYSDHGHNIYMNMRDEANKAYELGQNFLMAALVNHVASAFDAQYVINKKYRIKTKLRIENDDKSQVLSTNNYKLIYSVNF